MTNRIKEHIEKLKKEMTDRIKIQHIAQALEIEARFLTHQVPFVLPFLNDGCNLDFERKTATTMKHQSCGPTFTYSRISPEEIERNIKKRFLPDYVKKSLSAVNL